MSYLPPPRRGMVVRAARGIDEFTSWLLYGYETWLVAVLKAVPLFLFMYFLMFYIPNYVYYAVTLYVFDFSKDVGFLVANLIGGGNFTALIVMAVWAQAARGRQGFFWGLIRWLIFLQYLLTIFVLIPFMVFNLGGGSLLPPVFTLQSLALGAAAAGMGAMSAVYLWFEFRRITRQEAAEAAASNLALSTGR
jgi:cbb3-type cytochrome oxidase subunit 3